MRVFIFCGGKRVKYGEQKHLVIQRLDNDPSRCHESNCNDTYFKIAAIIKTTQTFFHFFDFIFQHILNQIFTSIQMRDYA